MAKKKDKNTNWSLLSKRRDEDTARYRNVHEHQQLERGKRAEKIKPTSRLIISIIVGILAFLLFWSVWSVCEKGIYGFKHKNDTKVTDTTKIGKLDQKSGVIYDMNGKAYKYVTEDGELTGDGYKVMFYQLDEKGKKIGKGYKSLAEVPKPSWFVAKEVEIVKARKTAEENGSLNKLQEKLRNEKEKENLSYWFFDLGILKLFFSFAVGFLSFAVLYQVLKKNLDAQNLLADTEDINQYEGDQYIQLPEEIQRNYDWFPDVGAHSSVVPSSMISHMALKNKGLDAVSMAKRHDKDVLDDDGSVIAYKGDYVIDDNGEIVMESRKMIDEDLMNDLFDASAALDSVDVRRYFDATKIAYNPDNKNRDKQKGYNTVADLINGDWELPYYETQQPAGAYIVDIDPVNTMGATCFAF